MAFKNRNTLLLVFILAISFVLHFINLKDLSLSNDELSAITRARYDTFSEMIVNGAYIDYHPAGIQTFIFFWIKIFGDDAFLIRLPFVLCAFGSTVFLYLICKKWYNEFVGLLSIVAFTTCSLVIQYTQIARMYSTGMFFCLLATYGWTYFLFNEEGKQKIKYWWIWLIGSILCIHNHYFSFAFAGILGVSGLFYVKKSDLKIFLVGGGIALLSFIPELGIFQEQMKTGDIGGWLAPPEKTFLRDFFFTIFNNSLLLFGITIIWLVLGILFPVQTSNTWRWRFLSIFWFTFVFLLAYLYSVLGHPVIQFSTLLFVLPFIFIFIFSFTPRIVLNYQTTVIAIFLLVGLYSLKSSGFYSKNHFGVFKEIAEDVNEFPANVPVVVNVINTAYFNYYYTKLDTKPREIIFKLEGPKDYARLLQIVDTCTSGEFGFAWTNSFHPYEIQEVIQTKYPFLKSKKIYFNATSYLYSKTDGGVKADSVIYTYFNNYDSGVVNPANANSEISFSGKNSEWMDSTKLFSTSVKQSIAEIPESDVRYATFSAKVYFDKMPEKASLVIAFDDSTHSYQYHNSIFTDYCKEGGKWYTIMTCGEFPRKVNKGDKLTAYFYNPGGEKFRIDDFKLIVRTAHDPYKK
ncbi:MAG: glycosyltransferase family 39 protein [Bacteroidia bacterium]|nr:glycosyltransferase family 39 protein [Bacteroidia bacterium]